ncbi:ABC transporter ATP-binding protein [Diaminobutyricibacter sp. McL0608]|uniref:ABC transporter ATP-binding protein n=1 Tax=Leifsonia sp. McL0608 TaxID=3143537 RepID=UPI0031F31C57
MTEILRVVDAVVDYSTSTGTVRALDGATLEVGRGEFVGVVGESGSGKSTLGLLVGKLLPAIARIDGIVEVDGVSVLDTRRDELLRLRRECLGFVPQDPVGALNPTLRIGKQMRLALHGLAATTDELVAMLDRVRIREPRRVLQLFPHQVSGGMAQRVAIAMAMARKPRILIADEPTAALDSNVREEVTKLIFELARESGTTVLWLSHDLNAVSRWCERIVVMYGGRVVEDGPATAVLVNPRHPYTAALASSDPARIARGERLLPIAGTPPVLTQQLHACAFHTRCALAIDACRNVRPEPTTFGGHTVLCRRAEEFDPDADLAALISEAQVGVDR